MSRMMRSHTRSPASRSPSAPSRASPNAAPRNSSARICLIPSRTTAWSSMMRMCILWKCTITPAERQRPGGTARRGMLQLVGESPIFRGSFCPVLTERWVSGLNQRFAKPSYGVNLYREFKSLPLRNGAIVLPHPRNEGIFFYCLYDPVTARALRPEPDRLSPRRGAQDRALQFSLRPQDGGIAHP